MQERTIADILGDFMAAKDDGSDLTNGKPVTIWLPAGIKDKYDRLQKLSRRQFSRKAREILIEAISMAEAKAS